MRHKPMYRYRNRYASSLWRQVLHPARIRQAHFGVGCRSYRKQGTSGQGKEYALFSGTGSRNSIKSHSCAVLSGDGIALLLTPGTGISKPPMVSKRHDTDGRWRQVTKLPRPCPQYPPFTLRYGNMTGSSFAGGSWRFRHYHCRSQALRVPARAFDVILLTGQDRGRSPPCPAWPAGSRRARAWAACRSLGPAQRKKLEY